MTVLKSITSSVTAEQAPTYEDLEDAIYEKRDIGKYKFGKILSVNPGVSKIKGPGVGINSAKALEDQNVVKIKTGKNRMFAITTLVKHKGHMYLGGWAYTGTDRKYVVYKRTTIGLLRIEDGETASSSVETPKMRPEILKSRR